MRYFSSTMPYIHVCYPTFDILFNSNNFETSAASAEVCALLSVIYKNWDTVRTTHELLTENMDM